MDIIFDTSIYLYKNYFVLTKFAGDEITADQIVQKTILQIRKLIRDYSKRYGVFKTKFHFALDSHSFRKDISSTYKKSRSARKGIDLNKCSELLAAELSDYNFYKIEGLEADDICYILSNAWNRIIILSADRDLLQCITHNNIEVHDTTMGIEFNYSNTDYRYEQVNKILFGCKSDDIARIMPRGVGNKSLKKAYDNIVEFNTIYEEFIDYKMMAELICSNLNIEITEEALNRNALLGVFDIENYLVHVNNYSQNLKILL